MSFATQLGAITSGAKNQQNSLTDGQFTVTYSTLPGLLAKFVIPVAAGDQLCLVAALGRGDTAISMETDPPFLPLSAGRQTGTGEDWCRLGRAG